MMAVSKVLGICIAQICVFSTHYRWKTGKLTKGHVPIISETAASLVTLFLPHNAVLHLRPSLAKAATKSLESMQRSLRRKSRKS